MDEPHDYELPVKHFNGLIRCDGVYIARGEQGAWEVRHPDKRLVIISCPCCHISFSSPRNAKLIANWAYPLDGSDPTGERLAAIEPRDLRL